MVFLGWSQFYLRCQSNNHLFHFWISGSLLDLGDPTDFIWEIFAVFFLTLWLERGCFCWPIFGKFEGDTFKTQETPHKQNLRNPTLAAFRMKSEGGCPWPLKKIKAPNKFAHKIDNSLASGSNPSDRIWWKGWRDFWCCFHKFFGLIVGCGPQNWSKKIGLLRNNIRDRYTWYLKEVFLLTPTWKKNVPSSVRWFLSTKNGS